MSTGLLSYPEIVPGNRIIRKPHYIGRLRSRKSAVPLQSRDTPFQRKLRSLLAQARESLNLVQEDVADAVGTSQTTISNIEKCHRFLDIEEFIDIAVALGADPHALLQQAMREAPPNLPKPLKARTAAPERKRQRRRAKPK